MPRAEALLVVPVVPAEGGNGLAMRAGVLLEGLARDHDVRVLVVPVFGAGDPPGPWTRRHARSVENAPLHPPGDRVARMTALLATPAGRARAMALHPPPRPAAGIGPDTAAAVVRAARGCRVVLVMRLYLAAAADELLDLPDRPPVLLDLDDLDPVRERRLGDEAEATAYDRWLAHFRPRFDALLVTSPDDAAAVGVQGARRVAVVPNGVRPPSAPAPADGRHDLLVVGTLSYPPNADGARWLCREVLPRMGDATLAIVGRAPPPDVLALAADPRVTVAADVPDVAGWYAGARVAAVPVRAGAGTRIKVLEAWAHGVPVVATAIGVEGLDADGAALVADDAAGFAAACRRVLADPATAAALVAGGRARLTASGTAAHAAGRLAAVLTDVVHGRAPGP